jgi:hypothetical protein
VPKPLECEGYRAAHPKHHIASDLQDCRDRRPLDVVRPRAGWADLGIRLQVDECGRKSGRADILPAVAAAQENRPARLVAAPRLRKLTAMPRYFFHLEPYGARDEDGQELEDDAAARREVALVAQDLARNRVVTPGARIVVTNEEGAVVHQEHLRSEPFGASKIAAGFGVRPFH